MSTPQEHAKFSPSASDRWIRCPRSFYLHNQQSFSSIYADEGTVAHWIGERCIQSYLDQLSDDVPLLTPQSFISQVIGPNTHKDLKKLDHTILVDEEFTDYVQEYVDFVCNLIKSIPQNKRRVKLEYRGTLTPDCFGTSDCVLVDQENKRLYIIDLKFGRGVSVEATENYQLRTYGSIVLKSIEDINPTPDWFPEEVHLQIFQPRVRGEESLREEILTTSELQQWRDNTLIPTIEDLNRNDTLSAHQLDICPGEKQCQWCSHKSCPARGKYALEQAGLEFAEFVEEKGKGRIPVVESINDDDLANILENIPMLKSWIKIVHEEALDRLTHGKQIPRHKLVESTKFRQYTDSAKVEELLVKIIGADKTYKKKVLTPAQAEKAVGKKHERFDELQSLIYKPEGSPTVVHESNKKPSIAVSAESVFKEYAN